MKATVYCMAGRMWVMEDSEAFKGYAKAILKAKHGYKLETFF